MSTRGDARRASLLVCLSAALPLPNATAADAGTLDEVVVTASRMRAPLLVVTDPRAPRQPLPAQDGADYLRTIPGFSVIRKGGTGGDPVFRGMAASRINLLLDGEQVLGGCGMRMDPPTAYVFPGAYDRIVVVKGPQSVLHGPGNSAAAVSFERDVRPFERAGYAVDASALAASHGRHDLAGDLRAGTPTGYGQLTVTRADSDDYRDGNGRAVHSAYERWSVNGAAGWTPDARTRVELSGSRSDGEAAYADRAMDGVVFDRENVGASFESERADGLVRRIEARAYYNYVDHVMDNYSLRDFTPGPTMPARTVQNPDRRTTGARVSLELAPGGRTSATVGADTQENQHSLRATGNQDLRPYQSLPRRDDAWFRSVGAYAEATHGFDDRDRLVAGARFDHWTARDERRTLMIAGTPAPNPTAGDERTTVLPGGFARYERDLTTLPATAYAGLGHVQRFPDYWELVSAGKESVDTLSAFETRPEQTTQLDAGLVYAGPRWSGSVSAFASDIDDYILIENGYVKGARRVSVTRNVDARTWGLEADVDWPLAPNWSAAGSLAWVRGENRTDDRPLAQMPPLEVRVGLEYAALRWSAGMLWRAAAAQDRYALNQGNVVGQDLGPTGGYGVLSINGGWRPLAGMLVTAGVDNLLDQTYAEHLSRAGASVSGYEQTSRVYEPGRTVWLKVSATLD